MSLTLSKTTKNVHKHQVQPKWIILDAQGKTLGRLSTEIANALRGKRKSSYTPHTTTMGDHVVVINCAGLKVTGKKLVAKKYHRYSGYPGGITTVSLGDRMKKRPTELLRDSVRLMLPKNKLQRIALNRLHLYVDDKHPHTSVMTKKSKSD